MPEAVTLPRR